MPLPYITAPGNIDKALHAIRRADLPSVVNAEFANSVLGIPGGSGRQIQTWLKKSGFINADKTPTALYARFRAAETSATAAAEALRIGYAPLYAINPLMHLLPDEQLRMLIMQVNGRGLGSNVVSLTLACINGLRTFAGWTKNGVEIPPEVALSVRSTVRTDDNVKGQFAEIPSTQAQKHDQPDNAIATFKIPAAGQSASALRSSMAYSIYLALPATSDASVFSAIFTSLKDSLLGG